MDANAVQVWTALFGLLAVIFNGVMAYFMARLKGQGEHAAAKAAEVAVKLEDVTSETRQHLDAIASVGRQTHSLVNSAMRAQKLLLATTSRALAERTGQPEHVAAAELAEKELREHDQRQAAADAVSPTPPDRPATGKR